MIVFKRECSPPVPPATLTTLPPDVLLRILWFLPRPVFGRRLARPSPLLHTALASRALRKASQRLLFGVVFLTGRTQVESWAANEARVWTTEVEMIVARQESGDEDRSGWLRAMFEEGLGCKNGKSGRWLRRLRIGGVEDGELGEGWGNLAGLSGLTSLSLTCSLPGPFTPSFLPALRRLKLATPTPFAPAACPVLPHLTHLVLSCPPPHLPDLSTSFPSLTHLTINDLSPSCTPTPHLLQLCTALSHAPPSLAHFATASSPLPIVLASLPPSIVEVTLTLSKETNLAPLVQLLAQTANKAGLGLSKVTLVGVARAWELSRLNPGAAHCAGELYRRGCSIVLR